MPVHGLGRAAPSRDVEAENFQLAGRVAAQHPEAHHADPDIVGGRLAQIVVPDAPPLLILVARLLAVMRQDVQHHPFAHPASQVRVDHAGDRYGRQVRVGQQMVDPSAERENGLQPREAGESARGMPPSGHEAHACRIRNLFQRKHGPIRQPRPKGVDPGPGGVLAGLHGHDETLLGLFHSIRSVHNRSNTGSRTGGDASAIR